MKILLTNDDGIDAPGLQVLEHAMSAVADVTVVAPTQALSGCSHRTTTDRPLDADQRGPGRFAVDGTPADCVRLGLLHFVPDADWVLSGVNDGGNLGIDVFMSGTVAAVREAALLGTPGIALSQYRRQRPAKSWGPTGQWVERVVEMLWSRPLQQGAFWNVNFPDVDTSDGNGQDTADVAFCDLELGHLPVSYEVRDGRFHYRGNYHERPGNPGTDVAACFSGQIAVTEIQLR